MNLARVLSFRGLSVLLLAGLAASPRAAVPPAELLLPEDTLAALSVPDAEKATAFQKQSVHGQLWRDPSLQPFADKFRARIRDAVAAPLERGLGVKFEDFASLARGQVTLALIANGWPGAPGAKPGLLLLLDVKDQREALTTNLTQLRQRWTTAGRPFKTEKIRETEFTSLAVKQEDLGALMEKLIPGPPHPPVPGEAGAGATDKKDPAAAPPGPAQPAAGSEVLFFGQAGPLFIAGNNPKDIEKVLLRLGDGQSPTPPAPTALATNHAALFRDAIAWGWMDFKPLYESVRASLTGAQADAPPEITGMLSPDKILAALGVGEVKSLAGKIAGGPDGTLLEFFVGAPAGGRQGLMKILSPEAKEAAPPPFVPADAAKFLRWRLDGAKAFATVEGILNRLAPGAYSFIEGTLNLAGRLQNPDFDFKKDFAANLGDDLISFAKPPRATAATNPVSPPTLLLAGSARPEKLVETLRVAMALSPMAEEGATMKEREFAGGKIYTMTMPESAGPAAGAGLNFAAGRGYAAMSSDEGILEEFLRGSEPPGPSLLGLPGLADAAQRVGGMSLGMFACQRQAETVRLTWQTLQSGEPGAPALPINPLPAALNPTEQARQLSGWLDFSLLPPWEQVAKYFSWLVVSGAGTPAGLEFKVFLPAPASPGK